MVAADYRLQQWFKIVQECESSELTIKAYCQGIGLREHQYYYMKKKVREAICKELTVSKRNNTNITASNSEDRSSIMWAEVNTMNFGSSNSPVGQGSIKITREDWTITIETGIDTEFLTEALKAVTRVCC